MVAAERAAAVRVAAAIGARRWRLVALPTVLAGSTAGIVASAHRPCPLHASAPQ